jgi:hypothetical protein
VDLTRQNQRLVEITSLPNRRHAQVLPWAQPTKVRPTMIGPSTVKTTLAMA